MVTIIAAIIGGIFALIAAWIGRAEPARERSELARTADESPAPLPFTAPRRASHGRATILYVIVAASAVLIPVAAVVAFRPAGGEPVAVGRGRYMASLPGVSMMLLLVLAVSILGLWRRTSGLFRLLFGATIEPGKLFRAGLVGLFLAFLMDNLLKEPILSLLYER